MPAQPSVSVFVSDRLICNITSVNLVGSSPTGAVTYSWTAPGGFSATTAIAPTSPPAAVC